MKTPALKRSTRRHFQEIGIIEELMLVEFVFDIGEGKFGTPDGNIRVQRESRGGRRCDLRVRE